MTDKVQKIKEWINKEQDGLMDAQGNFEYPEHEGAYHILCNLDAYIDSLQEESVSEDLELTWEDINKIISIDQHVCGVMGISNYTHNHQQAMEEVLKRFQDLKK